MSGHGDGLRRSRGEAAGAELDTSLDHRHTTTTTPSSPTGTVTCLSSKPTTAPMPWSNWPSATSRPEGSPTCPRASSTPTPPGSRSRASPTTWAAGACTPPAPAGSTLARNHRNAAIQAGVHARPAGAHRPTDQAPRAHELALARTLRERTRTHRRDPCPHLSSSASPPARHRPHRPSPTSSGTVGMPDPPGSQTHRLDPPATPAGHQRRTRPLKTPATTPRHAAERWIEG
jgi:hypothetical protein